jgi:hypothetical protein
MSAPAVWVRCERSTPARGTWRRYAGKVGRIVALNRTCNEIGVAFGIGDNVAAWFRPDELTVVDRPGRES